MRTKTALSDCSTVWQESCVIYGFQFLTTYSRLLLYAIIMISLPIRTHLTHRWYHDLSLTAYLPSASRLLLRKLNKACLSRRICMLPNKSGLVCPCSSWKMPIQQFVWAQCWMTPRTFPLWSISLFRGLAKNAHLLTDIAGGAKTHADSNPTSVEGKIVYQKLRPGQFL